MSLELSEHAIAALRRKRAELAGQVIHHQREIARIHGELVHIDAVLRLFALDSPAEHILPKYRRAPRSEYLAHGEIRRRCLEAMRDGAAITAEAVVVAMMRDKGLDADGDRRLRSDRRWFLASSSYFLIEPGLSSAENRERDMPISSKASSLALLSALLLLCGCATRAQRQFQAMKAGNEQASAEYKGCSTAGYNSPDAEPIRPHLPLNVADATLQQLADPALATPVEIQAILTSHPKLQACRKAFLASLTRSEPAVVPALVASYNKADDDLLALTQRKISWGEFVHRWRDRAAETNAAVRAADQSVIAGLKQEHQDEMARRARAAEALAAWAQTQEMINAVNRPVVTNCNSFGNTVNCVSR